MAYVWKSRELSMQDINRVISLIGADRALVLHNYHDYIPSGEYSDEEKLAFIIAAMPGVGGYTPETTAERLKLGPLDVLPEDSPIAKPVLVRKWMSVLGQHVDDVVQFYAPKKLVPEKIKENKEWVCICALDDAIKWSKSHGRYIGDDALTVGIVDSMLEWWRQSFGDWAGWRCCP